MQIPEISEALGLPTPVVTEWVAILSETHGASATVTDAGHLTTLSLIAVALEAGHYREQVTA